MSKIMQIYHVPTGDILVIEGDRGNLECLSLADYGRDKNVKALFLGLDRDIEGVPNGPVLPLEEKWVVTLSTQYGCSMGCIFCDVPKVGPGINATRDDLSSQLRAAIRVHPEVKHTKRLNIHYARMGEPTFNRAVLDHARRLDSEIKDLIGCDVIHPVVSTMLPANNRILDTFIIFWCDIMDRIYDGNAGLQFSINSTSDEQRHRLFNGNSLSIEDISVLGSMLPHPTKRKYTLNFALSDGVEIDAKRLSSLFSPKKFMAKITPMHVTKSCEENNVQTTGGYTTFTPYKQIEEDLKNVGFDVLVFVPSEDEDRGRITCGNAILSGTKPECQYTEEMGVT